MLSPCEKSSKQNSFSQVLMVWNTSYRLLITVLKIKTLCTVLGVAVRKLKNKINFHRFFHRLMYPQVFFTGSFTGCDHVKSALFAGFEILDPVKRPVKKRQNKIVQKICRYK